MKLDSLNNSNNEHLDKTVNDDTSKTERRFKKYNNNNPEESPENYGDSDQTEQTSIGDEEPSSSSDTGRTIRIIGRS